MGLSAGQQAASDEFVEFLLDEDRFELIISGFPGTGKTWLTKHLIELARSMSSVIKLISNGGSELDISCTSTTNQSARILSKAVGEPATTIHSLLGLIVYKDYKTGEQKLKRGKNFTMAKNSLIFVDEAGGVNKALHSMVRASTENCKTVYIGDDGQTAPIGENSCPVFDGKVDCKLTEILRQGEDAVAIKLLGAQFREAVFGGPFPRLETVGNVIQVLEHAEFLDAMSQEFKANTSKDHVRFLAWTNNQVKGCNKYLRNILGLPEEIQIGEYLINNAPISEGGLVVIPTESTVQITSITQGEEMGITGNWYGLNYRYKAFVADNSNAVAQLLKQFQRSKDWVSKFQVQDTFADLRPMHASTVHKAQGSTFTHTFIDVNDIVGCTNKNTVARMMTVATTRATDCVYFYGTLPEKYYS